MQQLHVSLENRNKEKSQICLEQELSSEKAEQQIIYTRAILLMRQTSRLLVLKKLKTKTGFEQLLAVGILFTAFHSQIPPLSSEDYFSHHFCQNWKIWMQHWMLLLSMLHFQLPPWILIFSEWNSSQLETWIVTQTATELHRIWLKCRLLLVSMDIRILRIWIEEFEFQ